MPRFVIQQHRVDQSIHWDLMLENQESLATWQVPVHPSDWPEKKARCRHIFDHRLIYLSYQGPLSDNRGDVQIVASGQYLPLETTETRWQVLLRSDKINGQLVLQHFRDDQWQMQFSGKCLLSPDPT